MAKITKAPPGAAKKQQPKAKKQAVKKKLVKRQPVKKKAGTQPVVTTTATNAVPPDYIATGQNTAALFTLKIYRGEGMVLLAMNWKQGTPPLNFVGFAIVYKEPNGNQFYAVKNRLSFLC